MTDPTHVFDGEPDERQQPPAAPPFAKSENVFRKRYRALLPDEIRQHDRIKDKAGELWFEIDQLTPCREVSLAKTKLEEAVVWAIKALTA